MKELIELFCLIWDLVEAAEKRAARPDVLPAPEKKGPLDPRFCLEAFGVSQFFEPCLEAAGSAGFETLANLIRRTSPCMTWSQNPSYTRDRLGGHFMDNYVFGQITGTGAPLAPQAPPSGFLLQGKDTIYPAHSHAPAEIYMALTPGAWWRLDQGPWFPVTPGQVIFHAPNQAHAIQTKDQGLLAFAAWLDRGTRTSISIGT